MLTPLLKDYSVLEERYDEMLAAPRTPRAHWEAFLHSLAAREGPQVSDTLSLMERQIRENGVTYNVYADPQGADRPWEKPTGRIPSRRTSARRVCLGPVEPISAVSSIRR